MKTVTLILLFTMLMSCFSNASKSPAPKILIMGDSISSGYGLEGYPDDRTQSYGALLAKNLASEGSENYVNLSIDGETTSGLLWRLENSVNLNMSEFDIIVLSSGGNDLIDSLLPSLLAIISELSGSSYKDTDILKKINLASEKFFSSAKKTAEGVEYNLNRILSRIREENQNGYLCILSLYDPFNDIENSGALKILDKSLIAPCIDLLNTYIKRAADKNGFDYIDISTLFAGNANKFTNIKELDIHPSAVGHSKISQELTSRYRDFSSRDVFLSLESPKDNKKLVRTALGVATVAATTLFGCRVIVLSVEKHRIKITNK